MKRIQKYICDYTAPIDFGPYQGGTVDPYYSKSLFVDIVKGDGLDQRNGNQIFVHYIDLQCSVYAPPEAYGDSLEAASNSYQPVTPMLVLFPDSVDIDAGGPPAVGSFLEHPFFASISRLVPSMDLEFEREYQILKRKTYVLGSSYPGYYYDAGLDETIRFPAHTSSDYKPYKSFKWRVYVNKVVQWAEGSAYPNMNECCFYCGADDPRIDFVNREHYNFQLLSYVIYFTDK